MEFHQGKSNFLLIFNTRSNNQKMWVTASSQNLVKRLTFQI